MHELTAALGQSWEPFVLVAGLLLIGESADREGLFRWCGERLARIGGGDVAVTISTLLVVAVVSAVMNLDTSVVFMTPVAVHVARCRRMDELPLLYGVIFMSNAASTLLLGSNLTNQLILAPHPMHGAVFTAHMMRPWVVAVVATIVAAVIMGRRRRPTTSTEESVRVDWRPGAGSIAVVAGASAMLTTTHPALWVLAVGVGAQVVGGRPNVTRIREVVGPMMLASLFVASVLVGWLGRSWHVTRSALAHAPSAVTAFVGAVSAVAINNLPATALYAGGVVAHPLSLLVGLDVGPNAFVTGSLSSILWWRAARRVGLEPSVGRFVAYGVPLTVVTIAVSLAVL